MIWLFFKKINILKYENNLFVLFTHGKYIKENVLKDIGIHTSHMNNLEAYLTEFKNNKINLKGIISEKELNSLNISIPVNIITNNIFKNCKYSYTKALGSLCYPSNRCHEYHKR